MASDNSGTILIGCWYTFGGCALCGLAIWLAPWGALLAWPAFALALVSAGYLGIGPVIFGKTNGRMHPIMTVFFAPFLVPLAVWRLRERDPEPHDLVIPGVRLGRLVSSRVAAQLIEGGVTAVLDMTCEHSEAKPFLEIEYCNIQVLDLTPPSIDELFIAVNFILEQIENGEVYVHCAQGFGRSATVVSACLLAQDKTLSLEDASHIIENARESVRLRSRCIQKRLEEFRTRWHNEQSD